MTYFPNNAGTAALADEEGNRLTARILRTMAVAVGLAVVATSLFASWRVPAGLLLGGALSLLSLHWMRNSISAAFNLAPPGSRPQIRVAQYVLRYFVVGLVVFAAYKLKVVSLPATLVGLCSFVAALFVEFFRELYFSIVHREEVS